MVDTIIRYRAKPGSFLYTVKSLVEARRALTVERWEHTARYRQAKELIDAAIAGSCTPRAALAAFSSVIAEQKIPEAAESIRSRR